MIHAAYKLYIKTKETICTKCVHCRFLKKLKILNITRYEHEMCQIVTFSGNVKAVILKSKFHLKIFWFASPES